MRLQTRYFEYFATKVKMNAVPYEYCHILDKGRFWVNAFNNITIPCFPKQMKTPSSFHIINYFYFAFLWKRVTFIISMLFKGIFRVPGLILTILIVWSIVPHCFPTKNYKKMTCIFYLNMFQARPRAAHTSSAAATASASLLAGPATRRTTAGTGRTRGRRSALVRRIH